MFRILPPSIVSSGLLLGTSYHCAMPVHKARVGLLKRPFTPQPLTRDHFSQILLKFINPRVLSVIIATSATLAHYSLAFLIIACYPGAMAYHVKRLNVRHHEIIRRAFLGEKQVDIALALGLTPMAISCLMNSPLAQAELARLKASADEKVTDVPLRVRLAEELSAAGMEAVTINRAIMNDAHVDVKVRAKIGSHFMDRVVFNKSPDDEGEGSYRAILRSVSNIERQLLDNTIQVIPQDNIIEGQAS